MGDNYYYKKEQEIDNFIVNEYGPDGKTSYCMAKIGKTTKNGYSFVSNYIIGSGGMRQSDSPFQEDALELLHI